MRGGYTPYPHPEERALSRVSKDGPRASWFETREDALLTMRDTYRAPLFRLLDEAAVLIGRAEINVDTPDPVAFEGEELGIAKALSTLGDTAVGHEGGLAFDHDGFESLKLDPVGDPPATLEIRRLVDFVVIRTGEAEIVGEGGFDGVAVVRQIGGKQLADDFRFIR